jgi:predicted N-acetyltransferase YhbS
VVADDAPVALVRTAGAGLVSGARAEAVSEIIRESYSAGDLVPGLPPADGCRADVAELFGDLAAGQVLWVAESGGRVVGTVRAIRDPTHGWEVRRLAVASWARQGGIARALLRGLEAEARSHGATRVALDAVVERGNPAFYARLGYRTERHFPAADKLLSEVRMWRDPREAPVPVRHDVPSAEPGLLVEWLATPIGTVCRPELTARRRGGPVGYDRQSLGVDFWAGAGRPELSTAWTALARRANRAGPGGLYFRCPANEIAAFGQPRQVHGDLLAWWRSPAVRDQRIRTQ